MPQNFDFLPSIPPHLQVKVVAKLARYAFFRLPLTSKWGLAAYEGCSRREKHIRELRRCQLLRKLQEALENQQNSLREVRRQVDRMSEAVSRMINNQSSTTRQPQTHISPLI